MVAMKNALFLNDESHWSQQVRRNPWGEMAPLPEL